VIGLVVRRLLAAIPLLLLITFFVFVLVDVMPGDAAQVLVGDTGTLQDVEEVRERLHLDDPLLLRYFDWLWHVVRGDLGTSLYSSQSVLAMILSRLPITLSLGLVSLVIVVLVGIPLGIVAAVRADSLVDRMLSGFASLSMAFPPFVLGLVLVLVFGLTLSLFPITGYAPLGERGFGDWLWHLVLPALSISAISAAELARQTRGALVDVLGTQYIRTLQAKGLGRARILVVHALRNAGIAIATVIGLQVGGILAGTVTVEFIFGIQGFGNLAVNAVYEQDVPVILGVILTSAIVVLIANLLTDLAYGVINPRLRRGA